MPRLLIHVEGLTEENFVNHVLARSLYEVGFTSVGARLLGNARQRTRRGGAHAWSSVRAEIIRHLCEDAHAIATTMVDYYALPSTGQRAWPGREAAASLPFAKRAACVHEAMGRDIAGTMGRGFDEARFVPFVVMHEFEGLLFSDCRAFSHALQRPDLESHLCAIRAQFSTPEEINDSPYTAPSKRVLALFPGYDKPLLGSQAAQEIGLARIRAECPTFDDWLKRLELSSQAGSKTN